MSISAPPASTAASQVAASVAKAGAVFPGAPLDACGRGRGSFVGVDLAKYVLHSHGVAADGWLVFRKKLSRPQFARLMADH